MPCGFCRSQPRIFRDLFNRKISHKRWKSSYYVTTPIYYVNSSPHIGHLYTSVLADAAARCQIMKNRAVNLKFMTGTDEHGQKISLSAQANEMDEQKYCDMISKKYRDLFDRFNICYTDFLRTTESSHKSTVKKLWNLIADRGYIYLAEHAGWYCISDEIFVPEQQLLPEDSSGIRYTIELQKPVQFVKELNYKFKLSNFREDLIHWLKRDGTIKPQKFQKLLKDMIQTEEVMQDLSISRPKSRMNWGIPVPNDPSQNIYVWLDALTSYITSSGCMESKTYWPPDLQIIGKDILKFHGVYWPAFLIAAGLEPPNCILCHSHWLNDGTKMSKSLGNVIDPMEKADLYTSEGFRYFLLHEAVPHSDGNYHESEVRSVINADLADNLGNFMSRCRGKAINPEQVFPSFSSVNHAKYVEHQARELMLLLEALPDSVLIHYDNFAFNNGIREIMRAMASANKFIQETAPWKLKDPNQKDRCRAILHIAMESLRICGILLQPIIPKISKDLLDRLRISDSDRNFDSIRPFSWEKNDNCDDVPLQTTVGGLFQRIKEKI